MKRTPFTQQLVTLITKRPAQPPHGVMSMVRFSTPVFWRIVVLLPHHAPGFCDARMLGNRTPGEMVTFRPLMAVTRWPSRTPRPLRAYDSPVPLLAQLGAPKSHM